MTIILSREEFNEMVRKDEEYALGDPLDEEAERSIVARALTLTCVGFGLEIKP